jgi:hypothetical protein
MSAPAAKVAGPQPADKSSGKVFNPVIYIKAKCRVSGLLRRIMQR